MRTKRIQSSTQKHKVKKTFCEVQNNFQKRKMLREKPSAQLRRIIIKCGKDGKQEEIVEKEYQQDTSTSGNTKDAGQKRKTKTEAGT